MWLDLNSSPSLNYIHFTCHLVFKNRNHCSLRQKKTELGSVYDMPEKGQTHLHQKYITQILEPWLWVTVWLGPRALEPAFMSHFKLDKQAPAFKKKHTHTNGGRFLLIPLFTSGHYLQLYLQSDGSEALQGSSVKKATSNRQRRPSLFTNGARHTKHIRRTESEKVPRAIGHWMRLWKYWIHCSIT